MLKSLVEKLPANHFMQGKVSIPAKQYYSLEERNDPLVTETNVPQKEYMCVDRNVYHHKDNHEKIAYAHVYPNPPAKKNNYRNISRTNTSISANASKFSQSPTRMWVVRKN